MTTEGFDIYDRRTIGGDDMLAVRRHWHHGARHDQNDATKR
jgi:diaminohydroxyphosphoribosylaminopyrimidine deaminase / 5-amino-6-(5-phosphoribosylamino)uracil reductase